MQESPRSLNCIRFYHVLHWGRKREFSLHFSCSESWGYLFMALTCCVLCLTCPGELQAAYGKQLGGFSFMHSQRAVFVAAPPGPPERKCLCDSGAGGRKVGTRKAESVAELCPSASCRLPVPRGDVPKSILSPPAPFPQRRQSHWELMAAFSF